MLTKEECENVLSENKIYLKNQMLKKERISHSVYLLNTVTSLLERLIHEHFDNPPLGFEELIKHKVIWDNELKEYAFVLEQYKPTILNVPAPSDLQAISLEYRGGEIECLLSEKVEETINDYYVPNRFYRKEVVQE